MPPFIDANNLKPFVHNTLGDELKLIEYKNLRGRIITGYDANILPKLCKVYLDARSGGVLTKAQKPLARASEILLMGLSRIGIIALIDEITGYQEIRDRLALNKIIDKFITDELQKWAKKFPDEFYKEIFRLNNWPYDPTSVKRPSVIGNWTKKIVYKRFPNGVLEALEDKNPMTDKGYRKHRLHQYLTEEIGNPLLKEYVSNVIFMMKACTNMKKFWQMFERSTGSWQMGLFEEDED